MVKIEMGWFKAINGNSVVTTMKSDGKMFVGSCDHSKGSIIGWLQWLAYCVVPNKDVCGSSQGIRDVVASVG